MPSRFEPCGISQLFAMRYGCVPIVRRTGGLGDTVSFYDPVNETGTGYCFDHYEPLELLVSMICAWEGFRFKTDWRKLQQRCMTQDFSWYKSAAEYIKIYKELSGQSGELTPEEADKITFLIKKNISWDVNGNGTLNQDVAENKTENNHPVSATEGTEIPTVSKAETPTVEDIEQKETSSPVVSSTIATPQVAVEKAEENQTLSNEVPEKSLSQTTTMEPISSEEEANKSVSHETSSSDSTSPPTNTTGTGVEQSPLSTETIETEESVSKPTAKEILETTKESNQPTTESEADIPKLKPRPSLPSPTGD